MSHLFRTPLLLGASLLLAACATTSGDPVGSLPGARQDDLDKTLRLAEKKKGEQALSLYLSAADQAWQQKDTLKARTLLESLDLAEATVAQHIFAATLAAELALHRQQPAMALQTLNHPAFEHISQLPLHQQIRSQLVRARALEATGQLPGAVRERIYLAGLLEPAAARTNIEHTWRLINQLPASQQAAAQEQDLNAWLQLSRLIRGSGSVAQKQQALQQWLHNNPAHPAAQTLPASLERLQSIDARPYQRIALLLPSNDRNQNVVEAIRNGFLAAYFQAREQNEAVPELIFVDSDTTSDPASLYQQMQHQGVDLIVGPWEKPLINRLAQSASLPIPTLALNYAEAGHTSSNLFQYGLSAEDEARQVAEHAWQDGLRSVAILVQQGEWGQRVHSAFASHWQQLGGRLVDSIQLDQPADLAHQVANLMRLRDSEARSAQLESVLQTRIHSEPARRRDLDFVFLAAPPQQARQVKPILTLQYADDLPVYATSAINPGQTGSAALHDLNDIRFTEIPWITGSGDSLQKEISTRWPDATGAMGRFYAMGADTWRLASQLQLLQALPDTRTPGYTGNLQLNPQNRVERHVDWVRFHDGQLESLR